MDQQFRSKTWKVKEADPTLHEILQPGDRLVFLGEGDNCRCVCLDKKFKRRHVWENAFVCEASKPLAENKGPDFRVLEISGAMLSTEHGPFILDAVLVDLPDGARLYGDVHAVHHDAPKESLAKRMVAQIGGADKMTSLSLDGDGPFGHASGQWHADPD